MQRTVHRVLSSPAADYDTWPEWSREKLDQNIPIDRKDTAAHTAFRRTAHLCQPLSAQTLLDPKQLYVRLKLPSVFMYVGRSQNFVWSDGVSVLVGKKTGC